VGISLSFLNQLTPYSIILKENNIILHYKHGHKMKLKFMTPREVNKDQCRLNEKMEKERIVKEEKKTTRGRKMKKRKWK